MRKLSFSPVRIIRMLVVFLCFVSAEGGAFIPTVFLAHSKTSFVCVIVILFRCLSALFVQPFLEKLCVYHHPATDSEGWIEVLGV